MPVSEGGWERGNGIQLSRRLSMKFRPPGPSNPPGQTGLLRRTSPTNRDLLSFSQDPSAWSTLSPQADRTSTVGADSTGRLFPMVKTNAAAFHTEKAVADFVPSRKPFRKSSPDQSADNGVEQSVTQIHCFVAKSRADIAAASARPIHVV